MKKKILIVDDTKSWLVFHKKLINDLYGDLFEITTAESAFDALKIIKHNIDNPFCLIITDLQMEFINNDEHAGEYLIKHIKNLNAYSNCPLVIISGVFNIEQIASENHVDCISKQMLINNNLLLKYMFEKL
ncbi:MAG: response regulator, partial [Candidatus Gastranaerophilales bacterium]|nr:response regulator [Candidatus Gastranaerophilales bacterium]